MEDSNLASEQTAELSALADGTLPAERRAEVEATIAASPELSQAYARERHVVAMLHELRSERAPDGLRARIAAERSRPRRDRTAGRRLALGGGLATALALAVAAIAIFLPAGTPGAPTLSAAAALATRGPSQPAPAPDPAYPEYQLAQAIDDLHFPNWAPALGWRATGQRTDRLGGHRAVTVFYAAGGTRVAYTILSTPPLAQPHARVVDHAGLRLHVLKLNGRVVVTWRRSGHTCVLSARGVVPAQLELLAGWRPAAL